MCRCSSKSLPRSPAICARVPCNTLQHTATHCNTLQHTITLCSTLQHSATSLLHDLAKCARVHSNFATHCNTLSRTATLCNKPAARSRDMCIVTQQHTATHSNMQPHTATHCNTLQHTATHCTALQNTATSLLRDPAICAWVLCNTLLHMVAHLDTLQRSATRLLRDPAICAQVLVLVQCQRKMLIELCNTLQHAATHSDTLRHTATHGNTRQHTATHGNTLQHTSECNFTSHAMPMQCPRVMLMHSQMHTHNLNGYVC